MPFKKAMFLPEELLLVRSKLEPDICLVGMVNSKESIQVHFVSISTHGGVNPNDWHNHATDRKVVHCMMRGDPGFKLGGSPSIFSLSPTSRKDLT
ncbi:MAG: hypothetical protein ACRC31_00920, partial [Cetobacterium sp.]